MEFALILPVLVTLVFGIVFFGRAYNAKIEMSGAVREGARAAAIGRPNGEVVNVVNLAAPTLSSSSPAMQVFVDSTCTAGAPGNGRVRATYPVPYTIPFVGQGTWSITSTGVMRCGL